ncbi:YicC/YloC family endoribonuclease [Candidatus Foliamicus sp.]
MIRSMTGYAKVEHRGEHGWLQWELRSVNHRHFDVDMRVPAAFRELETEFRGLLADRIGRGRVEARLAWRPAERFTDQIKVNTKLAVRVISYARVLAEQMRRPAPVSPLDVMRWPGVIEEQAADQSHMSGEARKLLHKALDELRESQSSEGEKLRNAIEVRSAKMEELLKQFRVRAPELRRQSWERVQERLDAIKVQVDSERLEKEVVLMLMRHDIAEELDRLDAHLAALRSALEDSEPTGKRINFLLQEIGREANTLAAKSGDARGAREAVDMRVLVEQMREQAQNIL